MFCRLHGNVESMAVLSIGFGDGSRRKRRDSIILAFRDAKISVLEFDDSIHGLRTRWGGCRRNLAVFLVHSSLLEDLCLINKTFMYKINISFFQLMILVNYRRNMHNELEHPTDAFFMEYIMCHYLIFVPFGLCFDQLLFFVWIYNENCGVVLLPYGANLTFEQGHMMVLTIHK